MRYNGVFTALFENQSITGTDPLLELQVPTGTIIDIMRMWISPDSTITDDVEVLRVYAGATAATGGSGVTEQEIQGVTDATSGVTALFNATIGAGALSFHSDAFHLQQGWLYLPVEDERFRIVGGSAVDNIGFRLSVAPAAAIDISGGITWGELG